MRSQSSRRWSTSSLTPIERTKPFTSHVPLHIDSTRDMAGVGGEEGPWSASRAAMARSSAAARQDAFHHLLGQHVVGDDAVWRRRALRAAARPAGPCGPCRRRSGTRRRERRRGEHVEGGGEAGGAVDGIWCRYDGGTPLPAGCRCGRLRGPRSGPSRRGGGRPPDTSRRGIGLDRRSRGGCAGRGPCADRSVGAPRGPRRSDAPVRLHGTGCASGPCGRCRVVSAEVTEVEHLSSRCCGRAHLSSRISPYG